MSERLIPSICISLFFSFIGIIIYQVMYDGSMYWTRSWNKSMKKLSGNLKNEKFNIKLPNKKE